MRHESMSLGKLRHRSPLAVFILAMFCALHSAAAETPLSVTLQDIFSATTTPPGPFRWMDLNDQLYSVGYEGTYDYTLASVQVDYFTDAETLHGTITATNLKPNFAYQIKLDGIAGDLDSNERIGLTGRWWQEEWNGSQWTNGQNLNNKGDGSSPNPNDATYFARRDIPDDIGGSPTGRKYRYTGYLTFGYLITDESGNATVTFDAVSSYHVMWKTSQRSRSANDGPIEAWTFTGGSPDPASAYDQVYPEATVEIFGEWERLPAGNVTLPVGAYEGTFLLTEESFHGSGLAGSWAQAMGGSVTFDITNCTVNEDCDDGNECTTDTCILATGTCDYTDLTGTSCDDGVYCNGADSCYAGGCSVHIGDPCAANVGDADVDCSESCNETASDCTANDPSGSACDLDGLYCTADTCDAVGTCTADGDRCLGGGDCNDTCNETADNCYDPPGTQCDDDGLVCTDNECDGSGTCAAIAKTNIEISVTVELDGVDAGDWPLPPLTRCIEFTVQEAGVTCASPLNVDVTFTGAPATGTATFDVPCSEGWNNICAKDEQHTLHDTKALTVANRSYELVDPISTPLLLIGGDTDNDSDVDVNDITYLVFKYGLAADGGGCPWNGMRDADFSNDHVVDSVDYTFVSANWHLYSGCSCTSVISRGGRRPAQDAAWVDLRPAVGASELRPEVARRVDLNRDGVFDVEDVREFEQRHGLGHALSSKMLRTMGTLDKASGRKANRWSGGRQ